MYDDDDDDEVPIVFKRGSSSSKPEQSTSGVKKSSSSQSDKQKGKPVSDIHPSNDRNSSVQKGKVIQSAKASAAKSNVEINKSPTSSSNVSAVKSSDRPKKVPILEDKASDSDSEDSDDDRPISLRVPGPSSGRSLTNKGPSASPVPSKSPNIACAHGEQMKKNDAKKFEASKNAGRLLNGKSPSPMSGSTPNDGQEAKSGSLNAVKSSNIAASTRNELKDNTVKKAEPPQNNLDDSEDERPISSRLPVASPSLKIPNERPSTSSITSNVKVEAARSSDDSDDEKPLSSKFQVKSNGELSFVKAYDSDDDKPLSVKLQQNGSVKRETETTKTVVSKKRPSVGDGSTQPSTKKLKLSNESAPAKKKQVSAKMDSEDESEHTPIAQRGKKNTNDNQSRPSKLKNDRMKSSPVKGMKDQTKFKNAAKKSKYSQSSKLPPNSGDGQKWRTLSHNGVMFPSPYKPHGIKMLYDGKPVDLTSEQEEVATMYALMLETDYVQKPKFNQNFFEDWRKILGKKHVIQDLKKCDFTPILQWHLAEKEKKKQMSSEEKKALKEEKLKQEEKYMWAILDGVKEKVGNFRVEPPGLFRGRGEHPKMGKLKKRIYPSDITINIGKEAPVPECPIPGESWKEVRHDNTVTWLAYWNDPINQKEFKYVFLAASSTLKGQSDKEKYEKARKLKDYIQSIRATYTKNFKNKDETARQIAVATYLIDRLALRAGNEKDDDEADTVGCCTLKVENVKPIPPNILEFDFLGKDSIKYYKQFEADPLVFVAVTQFRKGKKATDDLFDKLDTSKLNAHLKDIMPGLTAKVFRTYNASFTLDDMLSTNTSDTDVAKKVVTYNQANKEVAIICNHQRTVSKNHAASMQKLNDKINNLKGELSKLENDLALAKRGKYPDLEDGKRKRNLGREALEKKIAKTKEMIEKVISDMESKEDMKEIALGTSKLNYCDPRITVAWCKRNEVPIEKVFAKTMQAKFAWAMDVKPSFRF
ncbi:DNA topoisomerase 1 beta-like protein [Drosera capensis]